MSQRERRATGQMRAHRLRLKQAGILAIRAITLHHRFEEASEVEMPAHTLDPANVGASPSDAHLSRANFEAGWTGNEVAR